MTKCNCVEVPVWKGHKDMKKILLNEMSEWMKCARRNKHCYHSPIWHNLITVIIKKTLFYRGISIKGHWHFVNEGLWAEQNKPAASAPWESASPLWSEWTAGALPSSDRPARRRPSRRAASPAGTRLRGKRPRARSLRDIYICIYKYLAFHYLAVQSKTISRCQ